MRFLLALAFISVSMVVLAGCEARTAPPKPRVTANPTGQPTTSRPAGTPTNPAEVVTTGAGERWQGRGVSWVLPGGWQQRPGSGMRFATLVADGMEVTVFSLVNSPVGDNVNRWRGQIGLGPALPDEMAKITKKIDISGREATLVDTAGEQQRILALIIPSGQQAWFFKLQSANDKVAAQAEAFHEFAKSIQLD